MHKRKIIDVWMQHPTKKFINHPMFASLRKWMKLDFVEMDPPLEWTIAAMDTAQINKGLICSWQNAEGALISNEQVSKWVNSYPIVL